MANAIESGIKNDLFSGNRINLTFIKRAGKKVVREDLYPYRLIENMHTTAPPAVARAAQFKTLQSVAVNIPTEILQEVQSKVERMEVTA